MLKSTLLICSLSALLLAAPPARAGGFFFRPFTGDDDSMIDPMLTYTAKADFLGDGTRTVNDVTFTDTGLVGTNYTLAGPDGVFPNYNNNVTGNSNLLLSDFVFGATPMDVNQGIATLTLDNLVVGQDYVTTWYNAGFSLVNGRNVSITASDTNTTVLFDQNFTGDRNGNLLRYAFTATSPTITYTFDSESARDSFHHYAFSNAEESATYSTGQTTTASGPGPFAPFTPSSSDLLQTDLLSVNMQGNFTQEGAGGIPVLTDGVFLINGGNPADNSPLATVTDNSFIEFTLDTGVNTLGYDISSIETFGGWNDTGRDRQLFRLSISLVGSAEFFEYGSVARENAPLAAETTSAIRTVFASTLSGVDAIRFDFLPGQENTYAGLGEVDVIGLATVPEPASVGFGVLGGVMLLARRRRQ